jgi:DHA2 family multidrug resistance protein-like MFS transporter
VGTAVYRTEVAATLPPELPAEVADAARDTLGGALAIAQTLPGELGATLVAAAQVAFIDAIHFVALVSTIGAVLTAIGAAAALRSVPTRAEPVPERDSPEPVGVAD